MSINHIPSLYDLCLHYYDSIGLAVYKIDPSAPMIGTPVYHSESRSSYTTVFYVDDIDPNLIIDQQSPSSISAPIVDDIGVTADVTNDFAFTANRDNNLTVSNLGSVESHVNVDANVSLQINAEVHDVSSPAFELIESTSYNDNLQLTSLESNVTVSPTDNLQSAGRITTRRRAVSVTDPIIDHVPASVMPLPLPLIDHKLEIVRRLVVSIPRITVSSFMNDLTYCIIDGVKYIKAGDSNFFNPVSSSATIKKSVKGKASAKCSSSRISKQSVNSLTKPVRFSSSFANRDQPSTSQQSLIRYAFTCKDCGTNIKLKQHISRHILRCKGLRDFICPTCCSGFTSADSLRRHCRDVHQNFIIIDQDFNKNFKKST